MGAAPKRYKKRLKNNRKTSVNGKEKKQVFSSTLRFEQAGNVEGQCSTDWEEIL